MSKRHYILSFVICLVFVMAASVLNAQEPATGINQVTTEVEYNPETNDYVKVTKIGDIVISREYMTFAEYQNWQMDQVMQQYWQQRNASGANTTGEEGMLNKIPGFNEISRKLDGMKNLPMPQITPSGTAELTFQIVNNYRENPNLNQDEKSNTYPDFDENIQLSMNAKLGDLFDFDLNWNTQATFDFENQLKLKYEGKEDDILQYIEAGDVSFPLNTTLIKGSQQLFGGHVKLKFGKLTVDAVASNKETSTENIQVQGGASTQEFEIRADEYEENRHYFISQYFYDNYNKAMSTLPIVNSNIKITRIEVWRTNVGAAVSNNRNILALTDLGERNPSRNDIIGRGDAMPSNASNNLLERININAVRSIDNVTTYMQGMGMVSGTDYEKIENARLLNSSEYTFNELLGFISLNQPLSNDQMIAVAFQYQVIGDTNVYQVGELTTDGINDPNTLVVKLIKGTAVNTQSPLWKLMMKNVYFLRSTQIGRDNFRLNVLYESPEGGVGVGYFTEGPMEGKPLVEVFGLDRMDASQNYYYADGVMDWFDSAAYKGGIIQSTTGRIYFPYVEPFGKDLRAILNDRDLADKYCFDSLYTLTRTLAQQYADKNKFYIEGYYTSAVSGEISLGYSVSQGSVTVTAGGMPLIENVDYTVDYTMGTVRIINESILSSGTPISVSSENNSFSMMTKRMLGLHLNYEIDPNFNIGATAMNLYEKPLTQKNNFGEEPTSNSIWGLDLSYNHELPIITKIVDLLPGIQTKVPSNLSLTAEVAQFIPGMTNTGGSESSVSYIDDFEGAESSIDLKGVAYWSLASTPQDYRTALPMWPETEPGSGLAYGYNRARIAWYRIDNLFYGTDCPPNITLDDRSHPYARKIMENEVFPNKQLATNQLNNILEFNVAFYPSERGPYNYDVAGSQWSAGIAADGRLNDPGSRWGGIMRKLDYTDFETQNIETIEFWMMDPFIDPETGLTDPNKNGGKLYFHLGDISEDILRDGRKSFENGLPTSTEVYNVDTTIWGRVPTTQSIVNAFDNDEQARKYQDVGYDGLGDMNGTGDEQSFFSEYVNSIALLHGTSSAVYHSVSNDPSGDDFLYYRNSYYDEQDVKINDRYKYFNNPEGNSPADVDNTENYAMAATSLPNIEDINKDNTLSESENYYEYAIDLRPDRMNIGENYIVDIHEAPNVQLPNGEVTTCKWYQFRIPIRQPDKVVGKLNGFQSIRFMRMLMNQFEEPIILRFASLELVYGTWRKYNEDLHEPGDYVTGTTSETSFNISTVNIEENGNRQPVPYVLPPGIDREQWYSSSSSYTMLNEQALGMEIIDLSSGDARAIYRNSQYDMRYYGKLKMFVHAEQKDMEHSLEDDDLTLFIRLGSDYTTNYYEYELPLKLTPWGTTSEFDDVIWPAANEVEIDLQKFVDLKTARNKQVRSGNSEYSSAMVYSEFADGRKYSVLGSPNLGKVKVIMVGVRNPRKNSLGDGNDMRPKSVIVWINELRLSEYSNKGGWAAMAMARTNLADLGNLSMYGSYTTSGFGNLEDHLTDFDFVNQFQFQTTLDMELGRFLPEDWGMQIPFYLDVNKTIGSPEYNPLDPDVILKEDLQTYPTMAERDSVRKMTQERSTATNLTLTNVRKERTGKDALEMHFYDIENFSLSYSYSRERKSDEDISYFNKDLHRTTLNYNYSIGQPKSLKPFNKVKMFQHQNWRILKDFNLFYQPKNISFSTEVYRNFEESMLRNKSAALVVMKPMFFKQFTWRRDYGMQYDITRSLRMQYAANANARIDEPIGRIDTRSASDSVWRSFATGGTMQDFQQQISLNWDVPVNKLPYMQWLRMPMSYRTTYNFQGTTQALANMGSVLESASNFQVTANGNMQNLYNKIPLIKKAYAKNTGKKNKPNPKGREADKDKNKMNPKRGLVVKTDSVNADSLRRSALLEKLREVAYWGIRFATGVKSFDIQLSASTGSRLPGFMGEATIVGLDPSAAWNPGLGYVLGYNTDVVDNLMTDNLLSTDSLFNDPHRNMMTQNLTFQATVEPIRDLKIVLNCTENSSSQEEYYYKYQPDLGRVGGPLSYMLTGNYTATTWAFVTAFADPDELFLRFLDNRAVVAQRLADLNDDPYTNIMVMDSVTGEYYPAGYSGNQQTVLLTSFLSTYMGKDPKAHGFSPFLNFPMPNWTINYTGFNKMPALKKWFTNINLSHKYTATYSVGNYYTDAAISNIQDYDYGVETILNNAGDYVPPLSMDGVQISEQFNPLIRMSVSMVNSFQFNLSVQRNRMLNLSFSNNQLTEATRNGFTFGGGYRFKDVAFSVKAGDKVHNLKSDVVLQLNITYNSNKTNIRKINQTYNPNQDIGQISSGSEVWMAELSGEYAISESLTARLFFQTNINTPYISNSYPNSTTKGGVSVRFSF